MDFSILTPSFNAEKHIIRAIESVLGQTGPSWEHIVMDGGSQDSTVSILTEYPHLNWESSPDQGQPDAMNKAFDRAKGKYILYLNADDFLLPGALQEFADGFACNPAAGMIVANMAIQFSEYCEEVVPVPSLRGITELKDAAWPLNPVCYAYRREVQDAIGPFPKDEHFVMDYWFLIRAFYRFEIAKISFRAGVFDMHGVNKTFGSDSYSHQCRIRDVFFDRPGSNRIRLLALLRRQMNRRILRKLYPWWLAERLVRRLTF